MVFNVQSFLLLFILGQFIYFNQSLDCDCYDITTPDIQELDNGACFTYTIDASSCDLSGQLNILFGVNTEDECYLDENTLNLLLISSDSGTVSSSVVVQGDDEPGYLFQIDVFPQIIEICLNGIDQIGEGIFKLSDLGDSTECKSNSDSLPNFCGVCDSDEIDVCCQYTDDESCELGVRPTGNTKCGWDDSTEYCLMEYNPLCDAVDGDDLSAPCSCFIEQGSCNAAAEEGGFDHCSWDDPKCVITRCITEKRCDCYETEQDCVNIDDDEPFACIWDTECIEIIPTTEPTVSPTDIPTTEPTTEPTVPTATPTLAPYNTIDPSPMPTLQPTLTPTDAPYNTIDPSPMPTEAPYDTIGPFSMPTVAPISTPTLTPTSKVWTKKPTKPCDKSKSKSKSWEASKSKSKSWDASKSKSWAASKSKSWAASKSKTKSWDAPKSKSASKSKGGP